MVEISQPAGGYEAAVESVPALGAFLATYAGINFLHFALFLFLVCTGVLIGVSLLTPPPPEEKVAGLTLAVREKAAAVTSAWRRRDLALTVGLVICVGLVWIYFS